MAKVNDDKFNVDPSEKLVFGPGKKAADFKISNGPDQGRAVKMSANAKFKIQPPTCELGAGGEAIVSVEIVGAAPTGQEKLHNHILIQHIVLKEGQSGPNAWKEHKGKPDGSRKLMVYFEEKKDEAKKEEKKDAEKKEEKKEDKKEEKKEEKKDAEKKEGKKEEEFDQALAIFEEWRKGAVAKGRAGIQAEFKTAIKTYLPELWDAGEFIEDRNEAKNRYPNIFCLDVSRVVLVTEKRGERDYIHASLVKGPDTNYLCTQGPMDGTVVDFWRMIWQEKVSDVIMLCDIEEQGRRKCALYWPRSGQSSFGNFTIVMEEKETVALAEGQSVVLRKLKVTNSNVRCDARVIKHYQWTGWPDQSVPDTFSVPIYLAKVMSASAGRPHPVVVHCSAGVGRTGTMVALHMCLSKLLQRERLNVMEMVKKLRDQRAHSIQTEQQYGYLHRAIEAYFMGDGTRRL